MSSVQLRKADVITSIVWILFGLIVYRETLKFPRDLPSVRASGWFTGPWIVPGSAALLLVGLGVFLLIRAAREGGLWTREDVKALIDSIKRPEFRRALTIALLFGVYVFVLIGRVHYTLATFLFLLAFYLLFRSAGFLKATLVSAVASVAISWVFNVLARVPLP